MVTNPQKPFDIAIVGGGIAGLTLSITLLRHNIPHVVYESAAHFGEIGAGVGLAPNFVRTMELISPDVREAFLRCAELFEGPPVWFDVRMGDCRKTGKGGVVSRYGGRDLKVDECFYEWPGRPGLGGGVHRAHLLDELVKLIPGHIPRFGKRLIDIGEAEDGSGDPLLFFADGTTARHSAVIGTDGIKSRVREVVLGKEEARPVFSGKYAYRGLIPMSEALSFMGDVDPRRPQMYCGYHGHVLTFPIAKGTIMNVVAFSSRDTWDDPEWVVKNTKEAMQSDYRTWGPTVRSIISAMKKFDTWALFNHSPAKTYFQSKPRICLVGDAAHASTPHQGAGAGMCIEDCYILGELLAMAAGTQEISKAFHAYDQVRRPRSQKLVRTSKEAGMLYEFEGSEGDDLDAIVFTMKDRMDWIWDHDIREDLEEAKRLFHG